VPLVLATGAPTASGHSYADEPGVRHVYPQVYRRLMQPGARFVYYRGRRATALGVPGPGYFGCGVLGSSHDAPDGQLVSEILDCVEFTALVGVRNSDGRYFEEAADRNPNYWRRGVRHVEEHVFDEILSAADREGESLGDDDHVNDVGNPPRRRGSSAPQYGRDPDALVEVERFAVDVALSKLCQRHGDDAVHEMPRNNPGFDIRVDTPDGELHVEVKGTRQREPVFFLSEGERAHSERIENRYLLCVVSAIDLTSRAHEVRWHEGPITADDFDLRPRQWQARLSPAR